MQSSREGHVAVLGQGYVGLPLAIEAAKNFQRVFGVDVDTMRIQQLVSGISPVDDVSSVEIRELVASRKYLPTTDFSVLASVEVIVICVPTPLNSQRQPDLRALELAVAYIKKFVKPGTLVISESTSYPGTLKWIVGQFSDLAHFESLSFAVAPERINPSDANWMMTNTPRIVGGENSDSVDKAVNFYSKFCKNVIAVESPEIAEFAKLFENTFRYVNIGLVNEMLQLSNAIGVDFRKVLDAADTKPYGFMRFNPGAGIGGHCIPVDPLYLQHTFEQKGLKSKFIEISQAQNHESMKYVCDRIARLTKSGTVLLVGISYKADVADTRESPAEVIATELKKRGYRVLWTDALVEVWSVAERWDGLEICDLAVNLVTHKATNYEEMCGFFTHILDATGNLMELASQSKPLRQKVLIL